jgi:hypothetical protein
LDNFDRKHKQQQQQQQQQTSSSASITEDSSPSEENASAFSSSTSNGPTITDIVTMYILQSLTRYFGVKMSNYSSSISTIGDSTSPLAATAPLKIDESKPMKIIKFSAQTRLASPLFSNEKHISNNYDTLLDLSDDLDVQCSDLDERRMSISNIYSHDSISLSINDVIYTDTELYACKLKELTKKSANILNALEDAMTNNDLEQVHHVDIANHSVVHNSYKCVAYVVTSELPIYVLDYPMVTTKTRPVLLETGINKFNNAPAVMTKVRKGDKINVFCIREFSNSSIWLLLNSGWVPKYGNNVQMDTQLRVPAEFLLSLPDVADVRVTDLQRKMGERKIIIVECVFESLLQCKRKSISFRRHFKPKTAELNPFTYDKSTDDYSSIPV